jgi:hypothetical protein
MSTAAHGKSKSPIWSMSEACEEYRSTGVQQMLLLRRVAVALIEKEPAVYIQNIEENQFGRCGGGVNKGESKAHTINIGGPF